MRPDVVDKFKHLGANACVEINAAVEAAYAQGIQDGLDAKAPIDVPATETAEDAHGESSPAQP